MSAAGVRVRVYDPPMCCASGVCGPGVDPALSQVAADLAWLAAQGATVDRFNLAAQPDAFTANAKVAGLLAAFGDQALPAVLVGDSVVTYGRYPSRDELAQATESGEALPVEELGTAAGRGCAPGSGCC
ncbi:MAG: arsenite efflux transporter metallochaperone ArsD [Actinomycetes bacterium]